MPKKIPDNWVRNPDGSYDIHGHLSYGELRNLNWVIRDGRFTVRFRNVFGSFNCEMCGLILTFWGNISGTQVKSLICVLQQVKSMPIYLGQ